MPPWLFTTGPFNPNKIAPLYFLGSSLSLNFFKEKLDPRKYNGAILLGLNGPVVKSHGGTDSFGFSHSIEVCYKIAKGDLINIIKKNLNHIKNVNEKK